MHNRWLIASCAALGLVALAVAAFMLIAPRVVAGGLATLAQQQLGRSVSFRGGAYLELWPLAVRLDNAALSGANPDDGSFITAQSAVIPVTLGQIFGARPEVSGIALDGAEVALLIDERGTASWDVAARAPGATTIRLEQARLRYFDARNGQSMEIAHVDGTLEMRADGGVSFTGSAVINGRLVRVDAGLKSLARVNADGSPLELVLSANEGSASFSGRLATARVLSLAGPVSLSSATPGPALRLLGLPLPEGANPAGPITIDGALDAAGRAFAIRNATLAIGSLHAVGEIAADLRNGQPRLQASLTADTLWLDDAIPAAGATGGDWGRRPLPFGLLRGIDAELSLKARNLRYADAAAGPGSVALKLAGGKLDATLAAGIGSNGRLDIGVKADATVLPPSVSLRFDAEDTPVQPLLGALTGARQITGKGDLVADLQATGATQEELAGTLKGTARVGIAAGRIAGVDLAGLFLAAKHKILDSWQAAPGATGFDNLNGDATVEDGIFTFRELRMESPSLTVSAGGIIDVLRQGLTISATAAVNGQPLLPVPVIARGLWAKPRIYPDIPDILSNPEGGFARLQDVPALQGN
ncbi:MAG: AsmA family protein [Aestuariivirga sp.]|uniref:AsmA family protein n=1 Tax=Aestuariivirga sp. TaxID=2650926 RepID=UPI0025C34CA3|nr:AsmA family protein [Aestuariivirga sp.]MCA3559619.1 AsmA family protein [Aestuariivirga sp.]